MNAFLSERTADARPAAVLWDMDGTLIDSEPLWLESELAMLGRYGIELTPEVRNSLIGSGLRAAAQRFRELGVPMEVDEIIEEWKSGVIAGLAASAPLWRPGAVELLHSLRDAGIPCALVTMAVREIADAVVALLPEGLFARVVGGDEVAHEKPHPDPYLRGAQLLGVDIAECVALEDSVTGLRSAHASGAIAFGIPNLLDLAEAPAHEIWPSLDGVDAAALSERYAALRGEAAQPVAGADADGAAVAAGEAPAVRGPFQYGDRVQLTGPKGRLNTITLVREGEFHSHRGVIPHAEIVGRPDASVVVNSSGEEYLALRPLLSDFVMSMPRGAAIVYPKDAAQILSLADIFPGARVVEAGVGSGALSLHLLRGVGSDGALFSFERRDEFAEIATANVVAFSGSVPENWTLSVGDLQETLPTVCAPGSIDRVVLDMLAPWECVDVAAEALAPGGVLICYVATVTQLSRTVEQIRRSGGFAHAQASETLVRGWHVEGLAVRPDHRMVAHTGFLVTARRLAPGTVLPELKRRASKSDFSEADLGSWLPDLGPEGAAPASAEVWTPEAVGERSKSDKVLRKKVRETQQFARERGGELPAGEAEERPERADPARPDGAA